MHVCPTLYVYFMVYVILYVCSACMGTCKCLHLCTYMQRLEENVRWLPLSLSILLLQDRVSRKGKLDVSAWLIGHQAPRIHVSILTAVVIGTQSRFWLFMWVLEI